MGYNKSNNNNKRGNGGRRGRGGRGRGNGGRSNHNADNNNNSSGYTDRPGNQPAQRRSGAMVPEVPIQPHDIEDGPVGKLLAEKQQKLDQVLAWMRFISTDYVVPYRLPKLPNYPCYEVLANGTLQRLVDEAQETTREAILKDLREQKERWEASIKMTRADLDKERAMRIQVSLTKKAEQSKQAALANSSPATGPVEDGQQPSTSSAEPPAKKRKTAQQIFAEVAELDPEEFANYMALSRGIPSILPSSPNSPKPEGDGSDDEESDDSLGDEPKTDGEDPKGSGEPGSSEQA